MKKIEVITIYLCMILFLLWLVTARAIHRVWESAIWFFIVAIIVSVLVAGLALTCLISRIKKEVSFYKIYAIINVMIIIGLVIFSLINMWVERHMILGGLMGELLLFFCVPVAAISAIVGGILHKRTKNKG